MWNAASVNSSVGLDECESICRAIRSRIMLLWDTSCLEPHGQHELIGDKAYNVSREVQMGQSLIM
jgi:hypothetical protein